jgi:GAF domain-containing protein
LAALNAIATTVSQSLDLNLTLREALAKTLQVMEVESGGIYLLDAQSGRLNIAVWRGMSDALVEQIDHLRVGEGFSGSVALNGKPVVVPDMTADPRLTRLAVIEAGLRSVAVVPLSSRGTVLGTLFLVTRGPRQFGDQDLELLTSIGLQIGVAIENARLYEETRNRLAQLAALQETSRAMASTLELDELLAQIAGSIREAFDYYLVEIGLVEGDELVFRARAERDGQVPFQSFRVKVGEEGVTGWVAAAGEPLRVPDVSREPRFVKVTHHPTRSELAVPIRAKGKVIGVINVQSDELHAFDESDVATLQQVANQASAAIENAGLFAQEQRRAEQFRALAEVSRQLALGPELDAVLQPVVRLIQQTFGYYHVGIGLVEGDELVYRVGAGPLWDDPHYRFKPARLTVGKEGLGGWVAGAGQPLLVPDVSQEPRYVWMQGSRTRSELVVPIIAKGQTIGVLDAQSDRLNAFDDKDANVLQSLAHQAGAAIENARLYAAEQRRAEQFRVLTEVSRRITSILDIDELLTQVARLVQQTFGYHYVDIGLIEGEELVFRVGAGAAWEAQPQPPEPSRLKVGKEGIAGWVAATGEALLVPDVSQEPRFVPLEGSPAQSELTVPIVVKGQVIGVLDIESDRLNAFDATDLELVQALANQTGVAIENARLYQQSRQLAVMEERSRLARELHDAVTQTLFSASLMAESLPTVWQNDPQAGQQLLHELRGLNRGALAEMRTLLLELRPAALLETRLDDLLRQLAEAASGREAVQVSVLVEGDPDGQRQARLPAEVHLALYRIAQEALNNVAKHSQAGQASVRLYFARCDGDDGGPRAQSVLLSVSDGGCGFDPATVCPDRLGLGIMRERAEAIGAALTIESHPGEGTQVAVLWEAGEA